MQGQDAGARGLRLLVFDRTCAGRRGLPGLSQAWGAGRVLYRGLGRIDAGIGVASWAEALHWLATTQAPRSIAEIQFWGHGRFGQALVAGEVLDASAVSPGHPHHEQLSRIRARLLRAERGLWWFRTCETFGTQAGHDFARAWSRFFGCRAAGHTHVIGVWQSGLHTLLPDADPAWSVTEGTGRPATAGAPARALPSRPGAPNTISFLHGQIPEDF